MATTTTWRTPPHIHKEISWAAGHPDSFVKTMNQFSVLKDRTRANPFFSLEYCPATLASQRCTNPNCQGAHSLAQKVYFNVLRRFPYKSEECIYIAEDRCPFGVKCRSVHENDLARRIEQVYDAREGRYKNFCTGFYILHRSSKRFSLLPTMTQPTVPFMPTYGFDPYATVLVPVVPMTVPTTSTSTSLPALVKAKEEKKT